MAVTIKGFASDWSVPGPAQEKLDERYALKTEMGAASTEYADISWDPDSDVLPLEPDNSTVFGLGSSTIAGFWDDLAPVLADYGITYISRASSGEREEHTAARTGYTPALLTFPNDTIPGPYGTYQVTSSNVPPFASMLSFVGTIAGVRGTLSSDGNGFQFLRAASGSAVAIGPDTPFKPDLTNLGGVPLNPYYRGNKAILNNGKNNMDDEGGADFVNESTDKAYMWLAPLFKRALVLGHFVNTGASAIHKANVNAVNNYRRARYGKNFADMQAYLMSSKVWADTGITPTQQDLDQQAAGEKPSSLSSDNGHLRGAAQSAVVKHVIMPKLLEIEQYTLPPQNITSGIVGKWDASALAVADGAAVSVWPSTGGGTIELNHKTGSAWAFPTMAETAGPGGGKAVRFTRSAFSYIGSAALPSSPSQPFTYVALVNTTVGGNVIGGSTSSVRVNSDGTQWTTTGSNPNAIVNPFKPGGWQVVVLVVNGANSSYTVGGNRVTGTIPGSVTNNRVMLGGTTSGTTGFEGEYLDGLVAEVSLYNKALTPAEVDAVTADMLARHS